MKSVKKRLLSVGLALCMALTLLPAAALAVEEAVVSYTQPFIQEMDNWPYLYDEERGGDYMVAAGKWATRSLYEADENLGYMGTMDSATRVKVEVPQGATEVSVDQYYMGVTFYRIDLSGDYTREEVHTIMTIPFRYYLTCAGYTEQVYLDEYGQNETLYSKGDDHFIIPGYEKCHQVLYETGMVYIVHFKYPIADPVTTHQFTDAAPSEWAKNQVGLAIDAGIVPQSLQSNYTAPITRGEFCALAITMLETYFGQEIPIRASFTDTSDPYVLKAATTGFVGGTGGGAFSPDLPLTREQAALVLVNICELFDRVLLQNGLTFVDSGSVSTWAAEGVAKAVNCGMMGGVGDNRFDPQGSYTREQSIITILRAYNLIQPAQGEPSYMTGELYHVDPGSMAVQSLDYIYRRLKVPASMEVLSIRHGFYDRRDQTSTAIDKYSQYYVVSIMMNAMNSLGQIVTDTYVCLFNLDTGKTIYDLEGYAADWADYNWGGAKISWMELETEALGLAAGQMLEPFTREEVDWIVQQVTQ